MTSPWIEEARLQAAAMEAHLYPQRIMFGSDPHPNARLRFVAAPGHDKPVMVLDRADIDIREAFDDGRPDFVAGVLVFEEEIDVE